MEYPTRKQLELLSRLIQDGPRALDPNGPGPGRSQDRSRNLSTLRNLLRRLDLASLTGHVDDVSHRDVAFLDPVVAQQAYLVARSRGLILRGGVGLPPWSAQAAHLVTLMCEGATYGSLARMTDRAKCTVGYHLGLARRETGSRTTGELIATAFCRGWLPCDSEREALKARMLRH